MNTLRLQHRSAWMKHLVLIAGIFLYASSGMNAALGAGVSPKESLRGLQGVAVVIERLKPDIKEAGLSEEKIRTAVELILRSSGIRVLSIEEASLTASFPYLYVTLNSLKAKSYDFFAYSFRLDLMQLVSLTHISAQPKLFTSTWNRQGVGIAGIDKVAGIIRGIESDVKDFANDFLAVNPR